MILGLAASFLLGALGRRVCGGAFEQWTGKDIGDLPVRLFFGVTLGAAAALAGVPWYYCLALVPITWVGTTTGNFDGIAMGHGVTDYWTDFFRMSAHGLLSGVLPFLGAWLAGYAVTPIAVAALSIGPCYTIGWLITGIRVRSNWPNGLRSGTEWAECLWGGAMGVGTYVAGVLVSCYC